MGFKSRLTSAVATCAFSCVSIGLIDSLHSPRAYSQFGRPITVAVKKVKEEQIEIQSSPKQSERSHSRRCWHGRWRWRQPKKMQYGGSVEKGIRDGLSARLDPAHHKQHGWRVARGKR